MVSWGRQVFGKKLKLCSASLGTELAQNLSDGMLLMDLYNYTKDDIFSLETKNLSGVLGLSLIPFMAAVQPGLQSGPPYIKNHHWSKGNQEV